MEYNDWHHTTLMNTQCKYTNPANGILTFAEAKVVAPPIVPMNKLVTFCNDWPIYDDLV